jgi:hypothetical protein
MTVSASDNVGVNKVEFYVDGNLKIVNMSAPFAYSLDTKQLANGNHILMAKAFDAAGNNSSAQVTINVANPVPDTAAPTVTSFAIPASATSLSVSITVFSATDNIGVTGYMLTESASAPAAGAAGWSASAPVVYAFASEGSKTLYAWAKDAAGNVSAAKSASVTIALPDTAAPSVTAFSIPAAATALTVPVTAFTAADNVGVAGYLLTESAGTPDANSYAWSASAPTSYTFASAGAKTLYAWAKDAAGNVSASKRDRKSTRLNSSHRYISRMPSSA